MTSVHTSLLQNLKPYLSDPASWDVLVGHYLGVDHVGHAHGVLSQQMVDKLRQMDDQVAEVAGEMQS